MHEISPSCIYYFIKMWNVSKERTHMIHFLNMLPLLVKFNTAVALKIYKPNIIDQFHPSIKFLEFIAYQLIRVVELMLT